MRAAYIWDTNGKKYLDALSGLFVVQAGHGREELADVMAAQASKLAFFPIWSYAHPTAIELADRLAAEAPGDLNKVFFSSGGGESVETAWKVAKQYFKLIGKPNKTKVISRSVAYHGTTQGALSITSVPGFKHPFEPLVPGTFRVPNTNFYRAPVEYAQRREAVRAVGRQPVRGDDHRRGSRFGGRDLRRTGAECRRLLPAAARVFRTAAGDLRHLRRAAGLRRGDLCVRPAGHHVRRPEVRLPARHHHHGQGPHLGLLAARCGDHLRPDLRAVRPGERPCSRTATPSAGIPVSCAVALANLDIFEREDLLGHVLRNENALRQTLERLYDLPIVGDIRGDGYFYGIELVKDKATKESFDQAESERILRGYVSGALYANGLYCRADDRGDPVVQVAPPLICGQAEFDEMEQILRLVLTEAWAKI